MSATNLQTKPNKLAPRMPVELYNEAIKLFAVPSTMYNETVMSFYIYERLKYFESTGMSLHYYLDDYGNIIITKGVGPTFACFCAHLDTVHTYPDGFKLQYQETKDDRVYLFACDNDKKPVGIGGDDKCGIFVCLYLLERVDNIKIVFFSQEESGGTGSNHIDTKIFADCRFVGGVDRWNGNDFVNQYSGDRTISKAMTKVLTPILKRYGYEYTSGMFTDAFNLFTRDINISCFNMSCGYYSHHSKSEYVDTNELYHACLLAVEIAMLTDRYYYKPTRTKYDVGTRDYSYGSGWSWRSDKYDWKSKKYDQKLSSYKSAEYRYCEHCGLELLDYEKKYCGSCALYMDKLNNDTAMTIDSMRECQACGIRLFDHEITYCSICEYDMQTNPDDPLNDEEIAALKASKLPLY